MPEINPIIRHPAKYVPLAAVATGVANGAATPVSLTNPFPCSEQPLGSIRALVSDTQVAPGLALLVDCAAAGIITLELADGSQLPLNFAAGVTLMPFAIRKIASLGTTASFNAWVLD